MITSSLSGARVYSGRRCLWSTGHQRLFASTLCSGLFLLALVQLAPSCFSSASVSRLQLLRGRPLFLFPCGLQIRAWRVMLDAGFRRAVIIIEAGSRRLSPVNLTTIAGYFNHKMTPKIQIPNKYIAFLKWYYCRARHCDQYAVAFAT